MTALYRKALGRAFDLLPPALRRFHAGPGRWHGTGHLTQGNRVARRFGRLAGYPDTEGDLPLILTITAEGASEIWHRNFDGHIVTSRQSLRPDGRIAERIGPGTVLMDPSATADALRMTVVGLRTGPLPLPPLLTGGGVETAKADAVHFDVTARLPGLGLLIRYNGTLRPS